MIICSICTINLGRIRINTICLPLNSRPDETWEEYDATIAGWGVTEVYKDGFFEGMGKV